MSLDASRHGLRRLPPVARHALASRSSRPRSRAPSTRERSRACLAVARTPLQRYLPSPERRRPIGRGRLPPQGGWPRREIPRGSVPRYEATRRAGAAQARPERRLCTTHRRCLPDGPRCLYPTVLPLFVHLFAAERRVGERHAAVGSRGEQLAFPVIARLERGVLSQEPLAQGIERQRLGGASIASRRFQQNGFEFRAESYDHDEILLNSAAPPQIIHTPRLELKAAALIAANSPGQVGPGFGLSFMAAMMSGIRTCIRTPSALCGLVNKMVRKDA